MTYFSRSGFNLENHVVCFVCFGHHCTCLSPALRRDLDIYNSGAKHLVKNAGTTKEERESFDSWMKEGKVVDAFRRLHPDAKAAYTYWSVRTNAVKTMHVVFVLFCFLPLFFTLTPQEVLGDVMQ